MIAPPLARFQYLILGLSLTLLVLPAQTQNVRPQLSAPAAPAETAEQRQKRLDDAKALKEQTDEAAKNKTLAEAAKRKAEEEERKRKLAETKAEEKDHAIRDAQAKTNQARAEAAAAKAETAAAKAEAAAAKAEIARRNAAAQAPTITPAPAPAPTIVTPAAAAAGPGTRSAAYSGGPVMVELRTATSNVPGTLLGQANGGKDDEKPPYRVRVPYRLALGETEVTKGQFSDFVNATGHVTDAQKDAHGYKGCYSYALQDSKWNWTQVAGNYWDKLGSSTFVQPPDHPVVCVSWNDAQAYVNWVNLKANIPSGTKNAYRLPTEAEWEYAARAGSDTIYPWGGAADTAKQCRFANGTDQTTLPGFGEWSQKAECNDGHWFTAGTNGFQPNNWGLFHMHGNAWEWLQDCYVGSAEYRRREKTAGGWNASEIAPETPGCRRVVRGGSWLSGPQDLRSADRGIYPLGDRGSVVGFRLARTLP